MSLHDKTPCVACGHPRYAHEPEKTIVPKLVAYVGGECRECPCRAWQEPRSELKPRNIREKGARVAVHYLDLPVRYGTVQGTGTNPVTGTPNENIVQIKMDDKDEGAWRSIESYHTDWVSPVDAR